MITITPIELATLIAEGKPIELVDVRSTKEFEEIHIPGARSAPLGKLYAAKVVRNRKLAATEPLYVICRLAAALSGEDVDDCLMAARRVAELHRVTLGGRSHQTCALGYKLLSSSSS